MVTSLVYDPLIWIESADEASRAAEPPRAMRRPTLQTSAREQTCAREPTAATGSRRFGPDARSTTTSNFDWPVLLATAAAELSTDCVVPACFPKPVIKIHAAFNEPGTSIEDLLKLIQAEPRLADLLLVLANAALFGTGAKRVTELREAVSRLGRSIIGGTAVAYAVQRMKAELRLRSIAAPLVELWRTSLEVACIGQVIARRTKINTEDAFFTGLLHGIGYLYVMARSVGRSSALGADLLGHELIGKAHPAIGRAVLGRWGASDEMAQAVNDQHQRDRSVRGVEQADLTDILIVSIALAAVLRKAEPDIVLKGINSCQTLGMTAEDCAMTLKHAEYHLASLPLLLDDRC